MVAKAHIICGVSSLSSTTVTYNIMTVTDDTTTVTSNAITITCNTITVTGNTITLTLSHLIMVANARVICGVSSLVNPKSNSTGLT
jgi:hypothetical protein